MPQTTDDWYNDVHENWGLERGVVADEIFDFTIAHPEFFDIARNGNEHDFIEMLDKVELEGFDEINEANEIADELMEVIPDSFPDDDRSMFMGTATINSKYIKEFENDNVYIPSSNYCSIKALNKYFELQGRGIDVLPLAGVNPFKTTKFKCIQHMLMYTIKCECRVVDGKKKCDKKCKDKKRKAFMEKNANEKNKFFRDNAVHKTKDDNIENTAAPTFCKIRVKDGKLDIVVTNKAAHTNPKMCIGMVFSPNIDNAWHAILIKDRTKLTVEDIKLQLTFDRDINPEVGGVPEYLYKESKEHCMSWDIESHIVAKLIKVGKTEKYVKTLIPTGAAAQIFNIRSKQNIGKYIEEYEIVTSKEEDIESDKRVILERFFARVFMECKENEITELVGYAHNSSRFDTLFCMDLRNVQFGAIIKKGNQVKMCELLMESDGYKVKIILNDTLPYTLASLKASCKTFKTGVRKIDFDIIDKTRMWYMIHESKIQYAVYMMNAKIVDKYCIERVDIDVKLGACKNTQEAKLEHYKKVDTDIRSGYKDWRKYLEYDVTSLQDLIYKVEDMYNAFGCSITNHIGLPGIAYSVMVSYCHALSKCYIPKDPSLIELYHEMYYGGRTIVFHKAFDTNSELSKFGKPDYLICIDMNSLYPSVMAKCAYPVGKPVHIQNGENMEWLNNLHYVVKVDIEIPNIRYAYHPVRQGGALIYPSNQTITGCYNDVDLREMIKDGYKVTKFHHGVYFTQSKKIFGPLVQMIYDMRNKFKALNPDDPEYAKEYICKILLNAMYGKFGETIWDSTTVLTLKKLYEKLLKKMKFEDPTAYANLKKVKFDSLKETELLTLCKKMRLDIKARANGQYIVKEKLAHPLVRKPTYIAGYVTSYSRALVNEIIRAIGPENIYASDTDSLYMKKSVFDKANLKCGKALCGFKNDYGDGVMITKARFLDIKRAYLEFDRKVDIWQLDNHGELMDCCKDPITKKPNEGTEYICKTFKFKFTGICFKNVKNVACNALQPDDKALSINVDKKETYESYYSKMNRCSAIVDEFIENQDKFLATRDKDGKYNYDKKTPIKFMMERFNKSGMSVTIDTNEYDFLIAPERRGQWINGEFYALGYDKNKLEYTERCTDPITTLVNSFNRIPDVSYGISTNLYLRSKRPLFYPKYFKYLKFVEQANAHGKLKFTSTDEEIQRFNECDDQPAMIMEVGKLLTDAAVELNRQRTCGEKLSEDLLRLTKKYVPLRSKLESVIIKNTKDAEMCNELNMSDVIFDMKKKYDTDYYIVFEEEPKNQFVFKDTTKFKILYKQIKYKKEKGESTKESTYYEPNIINVKYKVPTPDPNLTYPIMMISEKFNDVLGVNNLTMEQTKNIYNAYYMNCRV